MMMHEGGQETSVQCTDPASLIAPSREEAGYHFAASLPEPERMKRYRAWHRVSQDPFSCGFRRFVIGSGGPVRGSRA